MARNAVDEKVSVDFGSYHVGIAEFSVRAGRRRVRSEAIQRRTLSPALRVRGPTSFQCSGDERA